MMHRQCDCRPLFRSRRLITHHVANERSACAGHCLRVHWSMRALMCTSSCTSLRCWCGSWKRQMLCSRYASQVSHLVIELGHAALPAPTTQPVLLAGVPCRLHDELPSSAILFSSVALQCRPAASRRASRSACMPSRSRGQRSRRRQRRCCVALLQPRQTASRRTPGWATRCGTACMPCASGGMQQRGSGTKVRFYSLIRWFDVVHDKYTFLASGQHVSSLHRSRTMRSTHQRQEMGRQRVAVRGCHAQAPPCCRCAVHSS